MKEHEIRPQHLQEEQQMLFERDVKRLMRHAPFFKEVPCPVCSYKKYRYKFSKYAMQFVKCERCRTIFANPRPEPAHIQDYYLHSENYKFWAEKIFPLTEKVRREQMVVPRVKKVKELVEKGIIAGDVLVEVGPGFGTFCDELRRTNVFKKIVPIEPTPELAESLRAKNFDVIEQFVEDVNEENFADAVVAFEVIEHMLDPVKFINNVNRMLKPGGIVMMTCPNGEGMDMLVLQEKAPGVDVEHVTLLNPFAMEYLLSNNGFEVITIETPGKLDTDIIRNRLEQESELKKKNPFFTHVLFDMDDQVGVKLQEFISQNNLSGNMMCVAQKINDN